MPISALEIRRNIFHLVLGVSLFFFVQNSSQEFASQAIGVTALCGLLVSLLSLNYRIPFISWFLDKFDRPADKNRFPGKGAFYFFVGSFIVVSFFSKDVASASIIILAVGDSVGHVVGASIGRISHPFHAEKKLEGTIAALIASVACVSWLVGFLPALLASAAAMLVEMVDFEKFQVNDNILVPLIAALVLSLF